MTPIAALLILAAEPDALLARNPVAVAVSASTEEVSGTVVEGGSEALTALLVSKLRESGWKVFEKGSEGRPALQLRATFRFKRLKPSRESVVSEFDAQGKQIVFFSTADCALEIVSSDGDVLARATGNNRGAGGPSYEQSERKDVEQMLPGLEKDARTQFLRGLVERQGLMHVRLSNASYAQVAEVEEALRKTKGVLSVELSGEFAEGRQSYDVKYDGPAEALAKQMGRFKTKLTLRVDDDSHLAAAVR